MLKFKNPLLLQVTLGVLILLFTFLVNLADSKISEFNNAQLILGNVLNSQRLEQIDIQQKQTKFEIYAILGTPPIDITTSSLNRVTPIQLELNKTKGCDSLNRDDRIKCTNQIISLIGNENKRLADEYNEYVTLLNDRLKTGTYWSVWQDIFIIFQIIFALLSILVSYGTNQKEIAKS